MFAVSGSMRVCLDLVPMPVRVKSDTPPGWPCTIHGSKTWNLGYQTRLRTALRQLYSQSPPTAANRLRLDTRCLCSEVELPSSWAARVTKFTPASPVLVVVSPSLNHTHPYFPFPSLSLDVVTLRWDQRSYTWGTTASPTLSRSLTSTPRSRGSSTPSCRFVEPALAEGGLLLLRVAPNTTARLSSECVSRFVCVAVAAAPVESGRVFFVGECPVGMFLVFCPCPRVLETRWRCGVGGIVVFCVVPSRPLPLDDTFD